MSRFFNKNRFVWLVVRTWVYRYDNTVPYRMLCIGDKEKTNNSIIPDWRKRGARDRQREKDEKQNWKNRYFSYLFWCKHFTPVWTRAPLTLFSFCFVFVFCVFVHKKLELYLYSYSHCGTLNRLCSLLKMCSQVCGF